MQYLDWVADHWLLTIVLTWIVSTSFAIGRLRK